MQVVSVSLVFLLFCCITISNASLEGCSLYAGGEFHYSDRSGAITPGLVRYDISSQTLHSFGNVYKDAKLNSIYEHDGSLYFSGDMIRVVDEDSMSIGVFDIYSSTLSGISSGLWTISNSLPNDDSAISPTLLFSPLGDDIIIAGHFTHQNSNPDILLNNIVRYSPSTGLYNALDSTPCSLNTCSIISLTTDEDSGRIFTVTMSNIAPYTTEVFVYENSIWNELQLPESRNPSFRILFDSLTLVNNSTLFAMSYLAGNGDSLADSSIEFSLVSWDLDNIGEYPLTTSVYEKSCMTNSKIITFPTIDRYSDESIIVAIPESGCPLSESPVYFQIYNRYLTVEEDAIPPIDDISVAWQIKVASADTIYISNESSVAMYSSGEWNILLTGLTSNYIQYQESVAKLYVSYNFGYKNYVGAFDVGSTSPHQIFDGDTYSSGSIRTIVDLNDDQQLVGGDFKYIGNDLIAAKFAALWDGEQWKPTLESNADNYLPDWVLLSAEAIGDTVFGIADTGNDVESLPLLKWSQDDGWLFLYKRPQILDNENYNGSYGTVYIDHTRDQIYFGGEFTVGLSSGQSCSGVAIYHYLQERWSTIPANLTRVNTFSSLNAHTYLQIGGLFSYIDENMAEHENYLILDVDEDNFLSSVPSIADSEVFSISLFPDQPQYSYVGGNYGQYGVEQLRYMSSIWSLSVVGNSPLKPIVYTLTARNGAPTLFAGGSFSSSLSKLDIERQEWSSIIPNSVFWNGSVRSLLITCPNDVDYYSFASAWDNSSLLDSFYSVPDCTVPTDAPPDFKCSSSLTIGAIIGLCTTIIITISIVSLIGFFAYKVIKERAKDSEDSIEYI